MRSFLSSKPLILDFAVVKASLLMYTYYLDDIISFFAESHQDPVSPLSRICGMFDNSSKVRTTCL